MATRTLVEQMVELFRRLNGRDPEPEVVDSIRESAENNGLDRTPPSWLTDMFEAVLARRPVGPVTYPADNGDVGSFWIEVSRVIPGWEHDYHGEWVDLNFAAIQMQVHISREAVDAQGNGCDSYTVKTL